MINIQEVNKKFKALHVLKNVSVLWEDGDIVALVGPNGCGKTTLIKSILGLVIKDSGTIFIDDKKIDYRDVDYRSAIGYMPQIGRYPENLTIGEVIRLIKRTRNFEGEPDEELYHAFTLDSMLNKKMGTLSGGTIQKVSACIAFMFKPDILILDEPTAGLDPVSAEILRRKILSKSEGRKLVVITSHILSELEGLANKVMFMNEGEVGFYDTVENLKSHTKQGSISHSITHLLKHKKL